MVFRTLDLTSAFRPVLSEDESILFVQNAVSLFCGKEKIALYENGCLYLTSYRICYVDEKLPRLNSVAIQLHDIDNVAPDASGLLKSSSKVVINFKQIPHPSAPYYSERDVPHTQSVNDNNGIRKRSEIPITVTWICSICSYSNTVPSNLDPSLITSSTIMPPCETCGISPPAIHVVKAYISAMNERASTKQDPSSDQTKSSHAKSSQGNSSISSSTCPRCTFDNHPSLLACEICGSPLEFPGRGMPKRHDYPMDKRQNLVGKKESYIRIWFEAGGEKLFMERLKEAMRESKWLDTLTMSSWKANSMPYDDNTSTFDKINVGVSGLELRGEQTQSDNSKLINVAFQDLEALNASVNKIIAMAKSLAPHVTVDSHTNLSLPRIEENSGRLLQWDVARETINQVLISRDMLGNDNEALYHEELSRNLAEFLMDDSRGILRREGGIMSLVDVWGIFNRAQRGVSLVLPHDLLKAAQLWQKLNLPVRLRRLKSGLIVHDREFSEENTLKLISNWLAQLHNEESGTGDMGKLYGRGISVQETAEQFSWSLSIAQDTLEMAEDREILCRDESYQGLLFWENWFIRTPAIGKLAPS